MWPSSKFHFFSPENVLPIHREMNEVVRLPEYVGLRSFLEAPASDGLVVLSLDGGGGGGGKVGQFSPVYQATPGSLLTLA